MQQQYFRSKSCIYKMSQIAAPSTSSVDATMNDLQPCTIEPKIIPAWSLD